MELAMRAVASQGLAGAANRHGATPEALGRAPAPRNMQQLACRPRISPHAGFQNGTSPWASNPSGPSLGLSSADAPHSGSPSNHLLMQSPAVPSRHRTRRRGAARSEGGSAGLAGEQGQDRGVDNPLGSIQVPSGTMMVPVMKKGYGAYGGGATLEKSKLDLSSSTTKTSPQLDLGGGGGNIGKGVSFGGGDGGDDGGDDDDYFGEDGDEDDDGDDGFLRRILVGELFDRASVEAVLQEWFRTMRDLPAGLYRAVEMGLVSSAQVARFMSIDARPTIARVVSRLAPSEISRAFIGRMMADPAFIFKVLVEQAGTVAAVAHWEIKQRGDKAKQEWDQILASVLTVAACNAAVVWCLSPTRSYGTTAKSDWQNAIQKLPNNMFDKSYPLREFDLKARAGSFLYKAAELSLVGTAIGGVSGWVSNSLVALRKRGNPDYKPSLPVPSVSYSTAAYGAYMGLSGNLRYQLVYGLDRALQQYFTHIPLAILGITAIRCGNVLLGEPTRLAWLGLDDESLQQQKAESLAYRRPSSEGARVKQTLAQQWQSWVEGIKKSAQKSKARRKARKNAGSASGSGDQEAPLRRPRRKIKQRMAVA